MAGFAGAQGMGCYGYVMTTGIHPILRSNAVPRFQRLERMDRMPRQREESPAREPGDRRSRKSSEAEQQASAWRYRPGRDECDGQEADESVAPVSDERRRRPPPMPRLPEHAVRDPWCISQHSAGASARSRCCACVGRGRPVRECDGKADAMATLTRRPLTSRCRAIVPRTRQPHRR